MELAQQHPLEDDQEKVISLTEQNLKDLKRSMGRFQAIETGDPFRRVSGDLFLQMASFFDSPSIALSMACCKKWKFSMEGYKEIFRSVRMSGKGTNIAAGIKFFSQRCGNSIRRIDIGIKDYSYESADEELEAAISPSSLTLQDLWVHHPGDHCRLIIKIASKCPSLKILSSTSMPLTLKFAPLSLSSYPLPLPFKPILQELNWNAGGDSLIVADELLNSLESARRVIVNSRLVTPRWLVALLSSASSTLVEVRISGFIDQDVDEIPTSLDLPNLVNLRLPFAPRLRSTGDSSLFFQSLQAPNLHLLCIEAFRIKDLSFLPSESCPYRFAGFELLDVNNALIRETGKAEAASLVAALKNWKGLQSLGLKLTCCSSSFLDQFIQLVTPLSAESVKSGYGEQSLLPRLQHLVLGLQSQPFANKPVVSGKDLAILVASRIVQWKGFSGDQIASVAAGHLSQTSQQPQGQPFAPSGTVCPISSLKINTSVKIDDEDLLWLKGNVPSLQVNFRLVEGELRA